MLTILPLSVLIYNSKQFQSNTNYLFSDTSTRTVMINLLRRRIEIPIFSLFVFFRLWILRVGWIAGNVTRRMAHHETAMSKESSGVTVARILDQSTYWDEKKRLKWAIIVEFTRSYHSPCRGWKGIQPLKTRLELQPRSWDGIACCGARCLPPDDA